LTVFLTGGTGFLGRQLARGLLIEGESLELLLRGESLEEASGKLTRALETLGELDPAWRARIRVSLGSLDAPGLGLAPGDRERILADCDSFLHCGANVRFDVTLEKARAVNVSGTAALLALAGERQRASGLLRFDHVSTAYVAGRRTDLVLETELDDRCGHKNAYERSKFEAERLVRQSMDELPAAVYRPSIVVGSAEDGRTTSFQMIYWPTKIYAMGLWRTCPGRRETPIDLVPVGFVREAILRLRRDRASLGRGFHLASGPEGAVSLGELAEIVRTKFGCRKPVRFVAPGPWMRFVHPLLKHLSFGPPRRIVRAGEFYVPYFVSNPRFDVTGARELLAATGLSIPNAGEYLERLFQFCIETDWGRSLPQG
jgi:long-chain acyl-CoA synthetase